MAKSDVIGNFKIGDTITITNPNTGKVDLEITVERINKMSTKNYYTLKLSSRLFENPKYVSKAEDATISEVLGGLYATYNSVEINEVDE